MVGLAERQEAPLLGMSALAPVLKRHLQRHLDRRAAAVGVENPGQAGRGPLSLSRPRHWDVQGTLLTLTIQDDNGKPLSVAKWRKSS